MAFVIVSIGIIVLRRRARSAAALPHVARAAAADTVSRRQRSADDQPAVDTAK
jgi:hypothetical protein